MAKKVKRKVSRNFVKKRNAVQTKQPSRNRSKIALTSLIFFAVLSLISYILYSVTGSEKQIYKDTFYLLSMVLGFIALAFLIAFLAIIFSKGKAKNK